MIGIASYEDGHFEGVRAVWDIAFPDDPPWNRAEAAIPAKVAFQPDLFLVALDDGRVVGTAMAGYDGHRGWLYALAVLPSHRRKGVASALVAAAEARLRALGCGKINLQVRGSNTEVIALYRRLGYAVEDRVSLGKRV
jgi:ribosomal protein S18 acetylase RimI-like enzyme